MNRCVRAQKGAVIVFFLLIIVMLFGMIGISVDVGHLFLVRSELRIAADAASLTGAGYLYPTTPDGKPNWALASQKALEAVALNTSDGTYLSTGTIEVGYWDLTGAEEGVRDPDTIAIPTIDDIPAVRVVAARGPGENGGSVPLYFGAFIGVSTKEVSAESVSGAGAPRSVSKNTLFPTVFPMSIYDEYWDFTTQKPKIDPGTGDPYVFDIDPDGKHGQWTSFGSSGSDTSSLQDLIENGNPEALAIGDEVYVAGGAKASLYNSIPEDVEVTIAILSDTEIDGVKVVIGFGTMYIHFATGGNTKSITVNLVENTKTDGGEPGGYYYGAYVPPKLLR